MVETEHTDAGAVRRTDSGPAEVTGGFVFRSPTADDAQAIHNLVAASPPLDTNSLYCNLLQCTHFADTCILAEKDGEILGWISGYRPPHDHDAMFIWQVAVDSKARGSGLGGAMLNALFQLPAVFDATRLLTTITPSNTASRGMFASFARQHGLEVDIKPGFDSVKHFGGAHESEELISIGPLHAAQFAF